MKSVFFSILLAFGVTATAVAQSPTDCGGAESPCQTADGTYHLRLPSEWDGQSALPVLIFFHGHRGTGRPILGNGGLATDFADQGYLLIAPNGASFQGGGPQSYPARAMEGWRDDVAFTLSVLDEVAGYIPIDRTRIYASGFSAGGSMAWLMACEAGEHLAGMVAVAGALRRPNTTDCAGLEGLPILHVHGFADGQVPFEGRAIRDWHQGSVWDSLARAVARNGCRTHPDEIAIEAAFRLRDWNASCAGAPVRLAIHDGGHGLPQGWTALARTFFEAENPS
ncbi:MAG: hypothetical protein AAF689_17935 [Pseudomonadota bacterium]